MHGVGVDLLEIERLERALARRPALAERLFTEAERAYAAGKRAAGAQHLAARFCAKEAVSKALAMDVFRPRDIEVVGTGGAPGIALHGAVAARAAELGVEVARLADPHARHGGAVAVAVAPCDDARLPRRDWLRAGLPDAERMRATDRWAIEERGIASTELMERAGAGLSRAVAELVPDGPVAVVCGGGQQRR